MLIRELPPAILYNLVIYQMWPIKTSHGTQIDKTRPIQQCYMSIACIHSLSNLKAPHLEIAFMRELKRQNSVFKVCVIVSRTFKLSNWYESLHSFSFVASVKYLIEQPKETNAAFGL